MGDIAMLLHNKPNTTDRIIRKDEMLHMTGLSETGAYRQEQKGDFPKRVKIAERSVGWIFSEVQQWIRDRSKKIPSTAKVKKIPKTKSKKKGGGK